jgi:plastocyanin
MKPNDQTKRLCIFIALLLVAAGFAYGVDVRGRISRTDMRGSLRSEAEGGAVVWLTPLSGETALSRNSPPSGRRVTLFQKNKRFDPHVLVVEVGSVVDFPNQDPFFHNVFSLFEGKRFDLGLYEAGETRSVRFDRPGICYIFCNIHSQMSAVVIVVNTPYFAKSNKSGEFEILAAAPGRYQLNVWAERCSPTTLKNLSRELTIGDATAVLGTISVPQCREAVTLHQNKYGKSYDPEVFSQPGYIQP